MSSLGSCSFLGSAGLAPIQFFRQIEQEIARTRGGGDDDVENNNEYLSGKSAVGMVAFERAGVIYHTFLTEENI